MLAELQQRGLIQLQVALILGEQGGEQVGAQGVDRLHPLPVVVVDENKINNVEVKSDRGEIDDISSGSEQNLNN